MIFKLSEEQYRLLRTIDFSELGKAVSFWDDKREIWVSKEKIRIFRIIITEEIDRKGLTDNQNEVTPYGRALYALHDEIYDQWRSYVC